MKKDESTSKVLPLSVSGAIRIKEGKATLHDLSNPNTREVDANTTISKEKKKKIISLFSTITPTSCHTVNKGVSETV